MYMYIYTHVDMLVVRQVSLYMTPHICGHHTKANLNSCNVGSYCELYCSFDLASYCDDMTVYLPALLYTTL